MQAGFQGGDAERGMLVMRRGDDRPHRRRRTRTVPADSLKVRRGWYFVEGSEGVANGSQFAAGDFALREIIGVVLADVTKADNAEPDFVHWRLRGGGVNARWSVHRRHHLRRRPCATPPECPASARKPRGPAQGINKVQDQRLDISVEDNANQLRFAVDHWTARIAANDIGRIDKIVGRGEIEPVFALDPASGQIEGRLVVVLRGPFVKTRQRSSGTARGVPLLRILSQRRKPAAA